MNNDTGSPRRKSNVALIVSLCINLILMGVIAVGLLRAFGPMFANGQRPLVPFGIMRLVPADGDKIKTIIAAHQDRILELRRGAMAARRDMWHAFAAPDFSQPAFDRALQRVRDADAAMEAEELKVVSESVAALTPDDRRNAVERGRQHARRCASLRRWGILCN
ncbi:MAG: periplasmic heavy metal sensor [Alphaproteobacteria bacterium]|nr:periplasmic heavy metal sensor [Alphaproteobacteria bacterium]